MSERDESGPDRSGRRGARGSQGPGEPQDPWDARLFRPGEPAPPVVDAYAAPRQPPGSGSGAARPQPGHRPPPGNARTAAPHRAPHGRLPRQVKIAGRALLGLGSAAVLLASGATWAAYRDLTTGMAKSEAIHVVKPGERGYIAPRLDGSVNLLLIGLDSRKDMDGKDLPTDFVEKQLHAGSSDIGGYNTNVLILMHIPADGGEVTAFSIARDDYVEEPGGDSSVGPIPNLGTHKIKEAYGRAKFIAANRLKGRGETDKAKIEAESREVGRESTIRAVQLLTGERVDHLAEINLLGFYDIAQAVGPIQVCLNHPVNDPIEDGAGTGLRLPAGYSTLDAPAALQFVRQRFHLLRGDFDRNRRQQAFLAAVLRKLRDEGVVGDLGRMRSLFEVVKKDLVIDDAWDVLDFAGRAQNLTGGNAVFRELPITGQPVLPGDGSVNTVNPTQIRRIVMTAFGDEALFAPDQPTASASDGPGPGTSEGSGSQETATPSPRKGSGARTGTAPNNTGADSAGPNSTGPNSAEPTADPHTEITSGPQADTHVDTRTDSDITSGYAAAPVRPRPPTPSPSSSSSPDTGTGTGTGTSSTTGGGHAVVDLFNASPRHGIAGSAASALSATGWPVDRTANAAAQSHSTVFFGPGAEVAASQLATQLGLTAVPEPRARTAANHVQVYLGADYTPPGAPDPQPAPTGAGGGEPTAEDPASPSAEVSPTPPPAIAANNGITCVN
jgi:LCP family protein required for cell wall assembly